MIAETDEVIYFQWGERFQSDSGLVIAETIVRIAVMETMREFQSDSGLVIAETVDRIVPLLTCDDARSIQNLFVEIVSKADG